VQVRFILRVTAGVLLTTGTIACGSEPVALAGTSPLEHAPAARADRAGEGDAGPGSPSGAAPGSDEAGTCAGQAPSFAICSDGQIVAILAAESRAHADVASAVRARLTAAGSLDLAEKLITDDSVTEVMIEGEMRETGIAAAPGGIDGAIAAESVETTAALAATDAAALDASYVDREVLGHLRALALLDRLLAPSVHDARIGALIARVRDIVAQHAAAAVGAQGQIEAACGGRAGICGSCPHIVE
jgi:hypothetical protein